jgi:hypothetical protein
MTVASRVSAHSGLLELVSGGGEVFTETVGLYSGEGKGPANREILHY